MAEKFKLEVEVDSRSLTKLKKTLSAVQVELKKDQLGGLEDRMEDLQDALTMNTAQLVMLSNEFERVTKGGGIGDLGGGGGISSGSADTLQKILETLEQNGQNIKQLTEDTSGHITFEQRVALKGQNLMIQNIGHNQMMTRKMLQGLIGQQGGNPLMQMAKVGGNMLMNKIDTSIQDMLKFQANRGEITGAMGGAVPLNKKQQGALGAKFGIEGNLNKVQGQADSKMGKILMKLDGKLGGKSMAIAGGIGLGAMGAASLVKKGMSALIESSPMLKQMVKLLNFGIMMILRPIGDFFGFVFRPILMMLLTKFIMPWYQKMMPAMITLGEVVGTKLARALEAFMAGDIVEAFDQLFGDVLENVDWWKLFYDIITTAVPVLAIGRYIYENVDWEQVNKDITAGLVWASGGIQEALNNLTTWFDETFGENSWFGQVQKKSREFWQNLINGMIGWLKNLPIVGGLFSGLEDVDFSKPTHHPQTQDEIDRGIAAEPLMDNGNGLVIYNYGEINTSSDSEALVNNGYLNSKAKGGKSG